MRKTRVKILIVKGDRFQAAKASADRGIPFVFEEEMKGQTVGLSKASENVLNEWLSELPHGPPFPVGALLYWNYKRM